MSNTGHTIKVDFAGVKYSPLVKGGGLGSDYVLAQFHFHWGSSDGQGSEHLINSEAYPMEVHLVHYKHNFHSLAEAVDSNDTDALAVLGFMFEIGKVDNEDLSNIVANLEAIREYVEDARVKLSPFNLFEFLPSNFKHFFRYSGSLTTPNCNEVVTWTVFKKTIKISTNQLEKFRKVLDKANNPISDNYRQAQPWKGRIVEASFDDIHWGYTGKLFYGNYQIICLFENLKKI